MSETVWVLPTAPPPSAAQTKLPGRAGIVVGIILIVVGIVVGIVLVVVGATTVVDGANDLVRVPIADGGQVRIDETGTQSIYAERPAPGSSSGFSSGTSTFGPGPDVQVRVTDPSGVDLAVRPRSGSETYTINEREGVLIAEFDADVVGVYEVQTVVGESTFPYTTLAIGNAFSLGGLFGILGGVFGGGTIVLIGIIVLSVSAVRRSQGRRRLRTQTFGPPGFGPPGFGPPGYGAPGFGPPPPGYPPQGAPGYAPAGWPPPPVAAPGTWSPPDQATPGWAPPPPPSPDPWPPAPPTTTDAPPADPNGPVS